MLNFTLMKSRIFYIILLAFLGLSIHAQIQTGPFPEKKFSFFPKQIVAEGLPEQGPSEHINYAGIDQPTIKGICPNISDQFWDDHPGQSRDNFKNDPVTNSLLSGDCLNCPNFDYSCNIGSTWETHASGIDVNACKMYRFFVISGNTYTFKTGCGDGATADFNTFIELINNYCCTIMINDDACENNRSSITWTANYTGYIYLKVRGIGYAAGKYTLAYKYSGACGSCASCPDHDYNFTPATNWQTHSSGIISNGCKMYRFAVTSGNTYTFKTGCGDGATANFDTYLELLNYNCWLLVSNDDGCEAYRSSITWTASYTGYVYLKVKGYDQSAGTYTLGYKYISFCSSCAVCPNFDFDPSMVQVWQTHASGISPFGCKMYRFQVISGNTYSFKTGCGDGATANFDTYLELRNSSCNLITSNDDGCEYYRSSITWTANYTGYVYLKVRGYSSSSGNYTLAFRYSGSCGYCTSCPNYDFNLTPNINYQTHASSIEINGCKMYRFFVTGGNTYTFKTGCGDGASANFNTLLELFNSNCSTISINDDGCENYRSFITWTANYTGYIYLKVSGTGTQAGKYTLAYRYSGVCGTCQSCPNYDYGFSPGANWQVHCSNILPGGCKMYCFPVTSGNTYTFKTGCGDGASANFDTALDLINQSCAPLVTNDDGCENYLSLINWTANYTGYVYLKVRGYGSCAGSYSLAYKFTGPCGPCVSCPNYDHYLSPSVNWQTHCTSIQPGGCKMYRFPVTSGNTYYFKTGCGDGATASFNTYLELFNSNCSTIALDDDGCENLRSTITWTANYTGDVYLKVSGIGSESGVFNLAYKYFSNCCTCLNCPDYDYSITPGTNWQSHCTSILSNGCKIYRFPVTNGYAYTFKTGCGDGATAGFDTYLELFDNYCWSLASNDNACENGRSSITWQADYSGFVYLKVSGIGAESGTYNLAFRYVVPGGSCVSCPNYNYSLAAGNWWQMHSSNVPSGGCRMYQIWVNSGNSYTFKTGCGDGATANFDTYMELFNSSCAILASDDDGCENLRSSITWTANYTGYVYLKIRGWGSYYGNYTLAYKYSSTCGSCVSCPNYDYQFSVINYWQTHCASILPNGCKMYRFWLNAGNSYTFKTGCGNGATANFDTYLELFNSGCSVVAFNDDGCENLLSSITWTANCSGYYYLKVKGLNSSSGSYNLAFIINGYCGNMPVTETENAFSNEKPPVCSLSPYKDSDGRYQANAGIFAAGVTETHQTGGIIVYPNPGNGRFTIVGENGATELCQLEIFNAFGQRIFRDEQYTLDASAFIDISDQVNGLYYLYVRIRDELFRQKLIIQR